MFFCLVTNGRTRTKEKTKNLYNKLPMPSLEVFKQSLVTSHKVRTCIGIECYLKFLKPWSFPVAQIVKCLPTTWETRVQSLGWEDSLEKEMATHSSTLAWKNPMDRGAW